MIKQILTVGKRRLKLANTLFQTQRDRFTLDEDAVSQGSGFGLQRGKFAPVALP
ncbi:hypothetical protein CSUNSWCD_1281 [Campylobacter showae CSUNSWCD]|uniref:Uncharacterized protein n=1 Tax=Campylobacter showae CSUNSWCD TaxID=1244083 RepID=M5IHE3_9BACT|nr:hypothetical protein CSUNSWCD_1281 [Campylobacter showae CSUNSWCD]